MAAGLDASAYRTSGPLAIFEVDHPATQAWKRERAQAAGLRPPAGLRHVPVDLESDDLLAALDAAGLDRDRPTFVSWLDATMYLTPDAVQAAAAAVGRLAPGTELVLDYLLTEACRDSDSQAFAPALAAASADHGEPWRAQFRPEELTDLLASAGFADIRHVDQAHVVPARLWQRTDVLRPMHLHQLAHATVQTRPTSKIF
jgi:methyltransferase (TIGR00027 family)